MKRVIVLVTPNTRDFGKWGPLTAEAEARGWDIVEHVLNQSERIENEFSDVLGRVRKVPRTSKTRYHPQTASVM